MVTSTQIRESIKAVVEAQPVFKTFYSVRNKAKDWPSVPVYPCVLYVDLGCSFVQEDGIYYRIQRVSLVVMNKMGTTRAATDIDAAIEAAERAALDIILVLVDTYGEFFTVADVRLSHLSDEYTVNETGTTMVFNVRGVRGACLGDNPPGDLPVPTPLGLSLDDLLDVDAADPADGDAILFDADTGRWKLGQVSGGTPAQQVYHGVRLTFNQTGSASSDVGVGQVVADTPFNPYAITSLFVPYSDADGFNIAAWAADLSSGGWLSIANTAGSCGLYRVTAAIDNNDTGWTFTVAHRNGLTFDVNGMSNYLLAIPSSTGGGGGDTLDETTHPGYLTLPSGQVIPTMDFPE